MTALQYDTPPFDGAQGGPSVSRGARQRGTETRLLFAIITALVLFVATPARAEEIKVMTSGAFTEAYQQLVQQFQKTTRHTVTTMFGASMGVFWGEPEHVELEFTPRVAPFVRNRIWHASQQIEERPDGGLRLTLHVSHDWALRSWVLGFGADVRVLRPAALAEAVRDEHRRAAGERSPA